jgi:glycosyltransferase involved in cell wall biosynthesis
MNLTYCCYFDHRYLPRGLAMIRSLKKHDPGAVVWVLCLSEECHQVLSLLREPAVHLIQLEDLEAAFPALAEARSNRSLIEFYFTCTPSLVRFVLSRVAEQDVVTYVDSDLYFFSSPEPLFGELGSNSVSIIPHRFPKRLQYLERYGLYNVGWMSFRNDARGNAVACWWQDRCNEWCYDVLDGDRFADQKYLDHIATDFKGVVVIAHPGANLAPWNLAAYRLSVSVARLMVDDVWPLIFFHFHGLRQAGERVYIPGHFRYRAPFGRLVRKRLYKPYIQNLEEITAEIGDHLAPQTQVLARYTSGRGGPWESLMASVKKPIKDALAMARGEFFMVPRRRRLRPIRDTEPSSARGSTPKLRVVVVHNYYGSSAPSGENNAADAEIRMLTGAGHDVHLFSRQSDQIREIGWQGLVHGGMTYTLNPFEMRRFRNFLNAIRPDIVHVHNTFPLISPAVFWMIGDRAASVLTLHNYRLLCAGALLLRDGVVCTKCLDEDSVRSAVRYGCYRQSRLATLPVATSIAFHKSIGTWQSKVDGFIALTEFQRDTLIAAGLPSDRLHVKPNFFSGSPPVVPWDERSDTAVFVGRLSEEKGVEYLIRAWLELGARAPLLRIIGDGPLREDLERLARSRGAANIEFAGAAAPQAVLREVAVAKMLFLPSIWFEGFPMVLLEALAAGTPSAVSNIGSPPTIIKDGTNGLVFEARSSKAIVDLCSRVWRDDALLRGLSLGARTSFESSYTEEINHRRLMEIYAAALHGARRRGARAA